MVALLLTEPVWVFGSGIAILAIVIARAGGSGVYTSPIELTLYIVVVVGMALSRVATDAAQRIEAANARAEEALRISEQRETELAQSNADLRRLVDEVRLREAEQARLLAENSQQRDAIRELSVPVLPLQRGTLVMPLIGALDSTRLRDLQDRALEAIQRASARRLLLDITGVPIVDTPGGPGIDWGGAGGPAAWHPGAAGRHPARSSPDDCRARARLGRDANLPRYPDRALDTKKMNDLAERAGSFSSKRRRNNARVFITLRDSCLWHSRFIINSRRHLNTTKKRRSVN